MLGVLGSMCLVPCTQVKVKKVKKPTTRNEICALAQSCGVEPPPAQRGRPSNQVKQQQLNDLIKAAKKKGTAIVFR